VSEAPWRSTDPLEPAEQRMLECAASGQVFDGVSDRRYQDPAANPAQPASIRAAVLRSLLSEDDWAVDARGVQLRRVRIRGVLDFESVTLRCALSLENCDLDDCYPAVFDYASVPLLVLNECHLAGMSADSLNVAGNLDLAGSSFGGAVDLAG